MATRAEAVRAGLRDYGHVPGPDSLADPAQQGRRARSGEGGPVAGPGPCRFMIVACGSTKGGLAGPPAELAWPKKTWEAFFSWAARHQGWAPLMGRAPPDKGNPESSLPRLASRDPAG